MSPASKAKTHSIDERDLRATLSHWLVRPEEFLRRVQEARLQREWAELTAELDVLFPKLKAAEGREWLRIMGRIEALEEKRTANFNARFPKTPMPEGA